MCFYTKGSQRKKIARIIEGNKQTFYRWGKEFGGLDMTERKKLKSLEKENARSKTLADALSPDNEII